MPAYGLPGRNYHRRTVQWLRNNKERKQKPGIRIGVWNMCTMKRRGKMQHVMSEETSASDF